MRTPVVLASKSEARRELLRKFLRGSIIAVEPLFELPMPRNGNFKSAARHAVLAALTKALSVFDMNPPKKICVIAADTVVHVDEKLLGKARSAREAIKYLELLRGRWHVVITGVVVINVPERALALDYAVTHVKMKDYTYEELLSYVRTGEWRGKAGAYAIQGRGAILVEAIMGSYYNVVGLPVELLYELMKKVNFPLTAWLP